MATALQTPFFIDMGGFSKTEIGVIAKTASLVAMTIGIIVGGIVMIKLSINRALCCLALCKLPVFLVLLRLLKLAIITLL